MKIHDTMSESRVEIDITQKVRVYLCGVTVYDDSHIGHARTVIVFDVLRRYLESKGATVEMVQNFTDVDDKIIDRAGREGTAAAEVSSRYIRNYHDEFDRMNVIRADIYPRATQHIAEMQEIIRVLIKRKTAYATKNGIYFDISRISGYGTLSGKDPAELHAGSRVEVDTEKRNPGDFALWKFATGDPSWDSPWGRGRPGWHIECSAMSLKYFGAGFEIHGGGRDLIFPHHENEIAQSEAYAKTRFARAWMHVGMITINGEKMSKSRGNVKYVRDLLERWGPNVIRLFCLSGHYSKPVDYSEDLLQEHRVNWHRARLAYHRLIQSDDAPQGREKDVALKSIEHEFDDALEGNLNTRLAMVAFYKLCTQCLNDRITDSAAGRTVTVLEKMMEILGLRIRSIRGDERTRIESLVAKRNDLRRGGDYAKADEIRNALASERIELEDEDGRTVWLASDF